MTSLLTLKVPNIHSTEEDMAKYLFRGNESTLGSGERRLKGVRIQTILSVYWLHALDQRMYVGVFVLGSLISSCSVRVDERGENVSRRLYFGENTTGPHN